MPNKHTCITFLAGLIGGIIGAALFTASPLQAQARGQSSQQYNTQGARVSFIGPHTGGQGALFLFDEKGGLITQMGSYPVGAEKGQALFGMHDRQNKLRFLFRLHGAKDSPTLIMKDSRGMDRIVMGLDGYSEAPYFKYTDKNGRMRDLLAQ